MNCTVRYAFVLSLPACMEGKTYRVACQHMFSHATDCEGGLENININIDIPAWSLMLAQHRDAFWDGLDICPRTCPSLNNVRMQHGLRGLL